MKVRREGRSGRPPQMGSPTLEQEIPLHDRRRRSGELDDEVGNAVAVRVALDEPVAVALIGAKLARGGGAGAGKSVRPDPVERLVAGREAVRVDQVEVNLVGSRREVEDLVDRRTGGLPGGGVAEDVRARPAGE